MENNKLKIAVHYESFHADDVLAVALVKKFVNDDIVVSRVPHNTDNFMEYDLVLDVGLKYDSIKYFDHHQYKSAPSAAKLYWDSLNLNYPSIDALVNLVSDFDTGISKCNKFEYPRLIAGFNSADVHDANEQFKRFMQAVEFTSILLTEYVVYDTEKEQTRVIVEETLVKNGVMILPKYCKGWQEFVNGERKPNVTRVVWYNDSNNLWYIQVPSISKDSYALHGNPLNPNSSMEFVHANGFLATCKDVPTLVAYLKQNP